MFSLSHLSVIRSAEIEAIASFLERDARILEIGAGTGEQALTLQRWGFDVTAIEITDSNYAKNRVFPVIDYDGAHFPLPDASVDVVFSSNVLEHVRDLPQIYSEIRRVLKPGGYCVHVMPTTAWRVWTTLSSYPDAFVCLFAAIPRIVPRSLPNRDELQRLAAEWYRAIRSVGGRLFVRRHGERGNAISEIWLFNKRWWLRNFRENGFSILHEQPMGLFYTGNMLLGAYLNIEARKRLARRLGSACHLFRIAPH
ncbi:MAG: methyltransferase domain-containing protein [Pseudomonadota bacterium]